MGIDSSSYESLNEEPSNSADLAPITSTPNALVSSTALLSNTSNLQTLPPLPLNRPRIISSSSSAFTSYVRRRGEPDGGGNEAEVKASSSTTTVAAATNLCSLYPNLDSSLNNTTDSELSDGYISQTHLNKIGPPRLGYSSLRGEVRVCRPGGGGESDAAFTPSPPVTNQNPVDQTVSMALAHQTRIRSLYSGIGYLGDSVIPEMSVMPSNISSRRPDSASSASSTNDWDGSGHATVLRRGGAPPMPPPRPINHNAPVYNNMASSNNANLSANLESNASSESDFERSLDKSQTPMSHFRMKPKIKLGNAQSLVAARLSKEHALFMDRLSVRSDKSNVTVTAASSSTSNSNLLNSSAGCRKPLSLSQNEDSSLVFNASNLYFSQTDAELLNEAKNDLKTSSCNSSSKDGTSKNNQKCIQDSIMRHMNREMTPTISDVYHERNIGLGLAPPLSKLLLSKSYDDNNENTPSVSCGPSLKSLVDAVNEIDVSGASSSSSVSTTNTKTLNAAISNDVCSICGEASDIICRCKAATVQKKSTLKPWLSNVPSSSIVKASDLTTADILERQQHQIKSSSEGISNKHSSSPVFNELLCKRDEGDGRSVADSQCSSNYKNIKRLVAISSNENDAIEANNSVAKSVAEVSPSGKLV